VNLAGNAGLRTYPSGVFIDVGKALVAGVLVVFLRLFDRGGCRPVFAPFALWQTLRPWQFGRNRGE
jgi:hypothetical protein